MMVYIFDAAKRVRKILSPGSITELVHDEGAYSLSAAISMDAAVKNGEHIGFKCVDGNFRIFTVTQSENFDDAAIAYITARDAIVMELMETIVEDLQQLDVQLIPAIEGLLAAAQTQSAWTVTGAQPERAEKSRAYYTNLWTMLETYRTLYEWQIIPYYTFYGGQISGRFIELKEDKAEFRGRILRSKKDASNVYDIKTNPPITRLYVLGKATGTEDEPKNENIREVVWSVSAGDPVDKPKGQPWIEDPQAVAEYGVHTAVVQINDAQDDKDLIAKGWKHLQTVKKPTSTVTATIQDLEQVPGYENQVIRLGDLVPIRLANATMEEARVVGIKRDYLHHWLTKLTIGDKEATIQSQVSSLMTNAAHTFERLTIFKNRFHEDEALIQLNAEMIQMNADIIEMNAREIRANAELIDLKASRAELSDVESRLSTAEIRISGAEAKIELKAEQTTVTALEQRLSQAEIDIDGANAQITMKASQSDVDALGERLSQAEIAIDGANAQINLKASQSTVDALGERVTSAELLIDGQNSLIAAKADKVQIEALETEISGLVKVDELSAQVVKVVGESHFGRLSADAISAEGSVSAQNVSASRVTTETLNVGGTIFKPSDYATKEWVEDQGYLKSANLSNYATTAWVNDQLDGLSSVYATRDWVLGTATAGFATEAWVRENFSKASATYKPTVIERYGSVSGNSIPVRTLNESGTVLLTGAVDAGDVYTTGYNNAKVNDLTIGTPSYYASSKIYTFPVTAIANDGTTKQEYFGLDATAAYDSGYADGQSAGGGSSGSYNDGYNAGYADAKPSRVTYGSPSYISSSKVYSMTVNVVSADGTSNEFYAYVDATAAYNAGYAAGQAAGGGSSGGGTTNVSIINTSIGSDNVLTVYATDSDSGAILATKEFDLTSTFNKGWNACRDACTLATSIYTIKEYAPGTLYMKITSGGQTYYSSVGSDWVRTSAATAYNRPAAKS